MSWGKHWKLQTFSISIKKKITKNDKDDNESVVNISYKIKLIDSTRFMASSSSNLVDNLAEGIHKIKYKVVIVFLSMKMFPGQFGRI